MNDSTSNQLNESGLDYSSESNQVVESRCVVDEQFVLKVGMTFKTLEEARKFYKDYSKLNEREESNFFVELNLDANHSIKNVFWADARSRAVYEYFRDVVSFDTTYNTNRGGKALKGILTDQCPSMQRDIKTYAFNKNWNDFVTKYGVGGNKWLSGFMAYEVVEQVFNLTFNKFVVIYDTVSREVKCQFLLFESRWILCCHSLSALSFERVDKVAPKYILECWSKNVKRRHTHIKSSQDELLLESRSKRFDDLVFRSHNICEFASKSEELTRILHWDFDNVMDEMQKYQAKNKSKCSLSH
ncbi:hypothetical protein Ahy_B03g065363 [Arachis hypogaea]|uniref:Protein FAR1-RELATED SEQUENCE n=1 Tax=Arachis hypogaea TaxID=3818 RepID=A0A445A1K2_ARAHY|nr:hypothetical protein Ahy_B03g065363 [Arachis hypogaea]